MTAVIEVDTLSKRFGSQVALDGVSLDVPAGVIVGLLGENGAGKTTAIRILLGLERADGGSARVLGFNSRKQGAEIRRRVGYVPERPTLYEWMTVAEIGWFAGGFFPGDGQYVWRYRQLIAEFSLPEDRKISALSKGMRAKVALSLAMAHEPTLLILDEPTSGLDPMVRREFLESMVDLAAAGRTVLLSSHQIGEVERVADIVAILRHGKLALFAPLDELKKQVFDLTITFQNGATHLPHLPGEIISRERRERQWRVLIRDADEGRLHALRSSEGISDVKIARPNLEDIFLAYMRPEQQGTNAVVSNTQAVLS